MKSITKEAPSGAAVTKEFEKVAGASIVLYISVQKADSRKSMELLASSGLRPVSAEEAILAFERDTKLKDLLEDKLEDGIWFYLDGKGVSANGRFMIDSSGKLIANDEPLAPGLIDAISGNRPPALFVTSAGHEHGIIYILSGICDPDTAAPVVLGVPKDWRPFEIARANLRT